MAMRAPPHLLRLVAGEEILVDAIGMLDDRYVYMTAQAAALWRDARRECGAAAEFMIVLRSACRGPCHAARLE